MAYHLELEEPIVIRHSGCGDETALTRLAALDSRTLPAGSFLLAEINGELVAAVPLDADAAPLKDPFRATANVRELLVLQAGHIRRYRDPGIAARVRSLQERPTSGTERRNDVSNHDWRISGGSLKRRRCPHTRRADNGRDHSRGSRLQRLLDRRLSDR